MLWIVKKSEKEFLDRETARGYNLRCQQALIAQLDSALASQVQRQGEKP